MNDWVGLSVPSPSSLGHGQYPVLEDLPMLTHIASYFIIRMFTFDIVRGQILYLKVFIDAHLYAILVLAGSLYKYDSIIGVNLLTRHVLVQ